MFLWPWIMRIGLGRVIVVGGWNMRIGVGWIYNQDGGDGFHVGRCAWKEGTPSADFLVAYHRGADTILMLWGNIQKNLKVVDKAQMEKMQLMRTTILREKDASIRKINHIAKRIYNIYSTRMKEQAVEMNREWTRVLMMFSVIIALFFGVVQK